MTAGIPESHPITDFFAKDYVNYSSYDNLRKIASVVDGQKNAARKILYTVMEKNVTDKIKVSQLGSKVAEFSEYLHGNLDGVIVNLAQDFAGTNNIPLMKKKGNFGTRFSNEAAASRYIYTYGSDEFFELFKKSDNDILKGQYFEGDKIEPVFYVPNLPILLINGSEGVSSGFAQKILPRDPEGIREYVRSRLTGKKPRYNFNPYYKGFGGSVEQGEHSAQWLIKGKVERKGINKVQITEVPVGYDLKGYIKVLDDLEDRKVIQSYRDLSEDDSFRFDVSIPSRDLKSWDDQTLMQKLKLIKKVSENYTVIDENNKIRVYESVKDVMDHYIRVKLEYMAKRKENSILELETEIALDLSKYNFIQRIVNDELVISKRKKTEIVGDLEKIENIYKKEGSYDYLLNMAIHSLTEERMNKLNAEIKERKSRLSSLSKSSVEELWAGEIK